MEAVSEEDHVDEGDGEPEPPAVGVARPRRRAVMGETAEETETGDGESKLA
jgi:hypothetical protein